MAGPVSTQHSALSTQHFPTDIFERAAALKHAGRPFVLATVVWSRRPTSAQPGSKGIVTSDGALFGWVGGSCAQPTIMREAMRALEDGQARIVRLDPEGHPADGREGVVFAPLTCHSGGAIEVFLEPFLPPLQLLVVGESPVADALVRLGHVMGYRIVAARPGSADQAPDEADERLDGLDFGTLAAGRRTVAVVASMGTYDEEAVAAALRAGVGYVGLVASSRRFAELRAMLAETDLPAELLARVKAPAGLDIAASAPEEIAVSILAEIIARRATLPAPGPAVATTATRPQIAIDPVCKMEVTVAGARHTAEHEGQTYYFCCAACRREFLADPARYLG
jgi:xanthine dehydrogenase accessory factor